MLTSALTFKCRILNALWIFGSSCVVVPRNRQRHLGDPTLRGGSPLEERARRKLHTAREGAGGGDDQPAGGGCGCSN